MDLVLEAPGQRIAGIEVKASSNLGQGDFSGLRALAETLGDKFVGGVVLYLGEQRLPFGDKLWALPISVLWDAADATPVLRSPAPPAYGAKSAAIASTAMGLTTRDSKPVTQKLRISQTKLAALCRKYGVAKLSLFGSASRNELRPESDVDLMVEFLPESRTSLFDITAMQDEFPAAFGGRKVDIVTPEILLNPQRRDSILPDLKPIYAA
ncbi:MAG: nucleotidyltransferase family protein [Burkholderiales bacterium]